MERFTNNKYYLQLVDLKPAWWLPHYDVYLPADTAYNSRFRNIMAVFNIPRTRNMTYIATLYLLIIIIIGIFTYILGSIAFAQSGMMDRICQYSILIVLF
jgi:hypothetical protein